MRFDLRRRFDGRSPCRPPKTEAARNKTAAMISNQIRLWTTAPMMPEHYSNDYEERRKASVSGLLMIRWAAVRSVTDLGQVLG